MAVAILSQEAKYRYYFPFFWLGLRVGVSVRARLRSEAVRLGLQFRVRATGLCRSWRQNSYRIILSPNVEITPMLIIVFCHECMIWYHDRWPSQRKLWLSVLVP